MGLLTAVAAKARGEVSTADLVAYGRAGSDAYGLLDEQTAPGYARLCAWNAYVLQTYGDKLLETCRSPGFAPPQTVEMAEMLYEAVGDWLERAQLCAADPGHRLDVYVPQGLYRWRIAPRSLEQLTGTRETLLAAQALLSGELASLRPDAPGGDRLRALRLAIDSKVRHVDALWTRDPGFELRTTIGEELDQALEQAYELGQVLAVPALLDELHDAPPVPQRPGAQLRLPGEPGFDPWCLTDPMERKEMEGQAVFREHLDAMWAADPHPERTLAIRAEIDEAAARDAVDYLPEEGLGLLSRLAGHCPWPGVMTVRERVMIGGNEILEGERFIFTVSHDDGVFERAIVVRPGTSSPVLDVPPLEAPSSPGQRLLDNALHYGFRVLSY
jgi:hypothetical protein